MNQNSNKNQIDQNQYFDYLFDSQQSDYINTSNNTCEKKKYQYIRFPYQSQIMISDLILLWESGQLKDKLNISAYIKLKSMFEEFFRNSANQNKLCILLHCLINKENNNLSIICKYQITPKSNNMITTLKNQFDELLPKLFQYIHVDGKELIYVINSALNIQQEKLKEIQKTQSDSLIIYFIKRRYFFKLSFTNPQIEYQKESLLYFSDIFQYIQKTKNSLQQTYIYDLLIEADFNTLKSVFYYIKNESALQFFQKEETLIADLELNNYFLTQLLIFEKSIVKLDVQNIFLISKNQDRYLQNLVNRELTALDLFSQAFQNNDSAQEDLKFMKFKKELINQLKIKFWVFENEISSNNYELDNIIKALFNKYSKAISIKIPFNRPFQSLIKIIVNNDKMEKIIEFILDQKINHIHKYVEDNLQSEYLPELNAKLNKVYGRNKQIYFQQLLKNPLIIQQVDMILDYCTRIRIMIQALLPQTQISFIEVDQQKYLLQLLNNLHDNCQNLQFDDNLIQQINQFTNKFCPLISIEKSSSFKNFKKNFLVKRERKLIQEKKLLDSQKKQVNLKLEFIQYNQVNIYNFLKDNQDYDQQQRMLCENNTWDQFQNSLIRECNIQLEIQAKKLRKSKYNDIKNKIQETCKLVQIPFNFIQRIFENSYEKMNEDKAIEEIFEIFVDLKKEDQHCLEELQKYVELDNGIIDNRKQELKEYFELKGQIDYQSIDDLKSGVKSMLQQNRLDQFGKLYKAKDSILQIQEEFNKQCKEALQSIPNFIQFKLQKSQLELENREMNKKIIEYYEFQLMEHLKQVLQQ